MSNCRCQSGLSGERSRLRSRYENFEEFAGYDSVFHLASRLGFGSAEDAWEADPCIESSVNPEDLRQVGRDSLEGFVARLAVMDIQKDDAAHALEKIQEEAKTFELHG